MTYFSPNRKNLHFSTIRPFVSKNWCLGSVTTAYKSCMSTLILRVYNLSLFLSPKLRRVIYLEVRNLLSWINRFWYLNEIQVQIFYQITLVNSIKVINLNQTTKKYIRKNCGSRVYIVWAFKNMKVILWRKKQKQLR